MTLLMCSALQNPTYLGVIHALNSCMLRYGHCRRLVQETVNQYLDMLGLERIEEFGDAEDLAAKLTERLRGKMERERTGFTSVDEERLGRKVFSVLLTVLDVVASKLGVGCS